MEQIHPLNLTDIEAQTGFNHRRHFDTVLLNDLAESIKTQGVIQPIIVRPKPGEDCRYFIVAGERRWRAANIAGLHTIPACIRNLSDAEAFAVSLTENKDREGISAGEEAQAARRAVDASGGNENEAARLLGWSLTKLHGRLQLLHATDEVLDALALKNIMLGHAELFATLRAEQQAAILPKLIANKVSVSEFAKQLGARARPLREAIFDTEGCNGCPNNSTQAALFETHIESGKCTGAQCWQQKTAAAIDARVAALRKDVPLVALDREKDPLTYTTVSADKVGETTYQETCKGCGSFGVLVMTAPGREGAEQHSTCFDKGCFAAKCKAQKQQGTQTKEATDDGKAAGSNNAKAAPAPKAKGGEPKVPSAVLDHIDATLRQAAAKTVATSPRVLTMMSLYAMRSLAGKHPSAAGGEVRRRFAAICKMDDATIGQELQSLAEALMRDGSANEGSLSQKVGWTAAAQLVIADQHVELAGTYPVDRAFLEAHTKSGLEALLKAAGFEKTLDGGEKAFKKLMAGKHADIIEAVLSSGHDFGGSFLPPTVTARLKTLKSV